MGGDDKFWAPMGNYNFRPSMYVCMYSGTLSSSPIWLIFGLQEDIEGHRLYKVALRGCFEAEIEVECCIYCIGHTVDCYANLYSLKSLLPHRRMRKSKLSMESLLRRIEIVPEFPGLNCCSLMRVVHGEVG